MTKFKRFFNLQAMDAWGNVRKATLSEKMVWILKGWLPRRAGWNPTRGSVVALLVVAIVAPLIAATPPIWARHVKTRTLISEYENQPAVELHTDEHSLVRGPEQAPLQIVVFTDFECQFCESFHELLKQVLEEYSGYYRLTYKHFPLSSKCNPWLPKPNNKHPRACHLAQVAHALGSLNMFWELGSELYKAGQSPEPRKILKVMAERAGLDDRQWMARINNPDAYERIQADIEEGIRVGVHGVPTVFVNGRRLFSLDQENLELILKKVVR